MSGWRGCSAGFTLLEVLVALLIVGTVATASLVTHAAQLQSLQSAGTVGVATELAQERLQTLQLVSDPAVHPLPDSLRKGEFDLPGEFRWEASSDPVPGTPLVEIQVEIHWFGGSYRLDTVVRAKGERLAGQLTS